MTIGELREELKNIPEKFDNTVIQHLDKNGNLTGGGFTSGLLVGDGRGRLTENSDPEETFAVFGEVIGVEANVKTEK